MSKEDIKSRIKSKVDELYKELISIRRHIHSHPELSFKEKNTHLFVREKLDNAGIKYTSGYCKYGIVAEIKGAKKGKLRYLRGDMDALPILEANDIPYKSKFDGIMHACGHDVHTTCVLGSALVLNDMRDVIRGTIRFLFQPGEEKLPGGASIMIKEGAVETKNAQIFAQHVHPPLEVGKVGFYAGEYMASADELFFEIIGKGGHAALPNDCIDTILVASEVVSSLHHLASRYSDPKVPTVLTIGKINSVGGATNIIPDKVKLEGTLRTMDEENRKKMHGRIRQTVNNICKSYGAKAKVQIKYGYPTLYNDPDLTSSAMEFAREYLGAKNVIQLEKRMTAEDFSYFSQMMPACFYRLGTGNRKKGITSPVHTPTFNIDERALKIGVGLMSYIALQAHK